MIKFLKKHAVLPAVLLSGCLTAEEPFGIVGGQRSAAFPYTALISSSGAATTVPSDIVSGNILSVAINNSSQALIGGQNITSGGGYAARLSPSGDTVPLLTPLVVGISDGFIASVAINSSSQGIIGGEKNSGTNRAYAAFVSSSGDVSPAFALGVNLGAINSVAINDAGQALIGGENGAAGYAAFISPAGTPTALPLGLPSGTISSVAINNASQGIVGGRVTAGSAYAALVSNSAVTLIATGITNGPINSVAINSAGQGLIGGKNGSQPYAAQVTTAGTALPIATGVLSGQINSVAINDSGQGIIGGTSSSQPYAALIASSGAVVPIATGITNGQINSVAINNHGQGLIGGTNAATSAPYAAIVSPLGIATSIAIGGVGGINTVALLPLLSTIPTQSLSGNNLRFANYINANAPQDAFYFFPSIFDGTLAQALESAAPTRNAISLYTADRNYFYLNRSLSNHLRNASGFRNRATTHEPTNIAACTDELTASTADQLAKAPSKANRPCTRWFEGIGAYSRQKTQKQTVGFDPITGAVILGFDVVINPKSWAGGGAAYSYTHIREKHHAGHSNINQEYLFVYGSYQGSLFYFDGALWGGLFQTDQVRNIEMTGFKFRSTSHPHGWQLSPHVELGCLAYKHRVVTIDPFVMVDWVSAWQHRFKEKGNGPFNAGQHDHYSSLLRGEIGIRFYETVSFDTWRLTFQEKGSYVSITPFQVGRVHAFLVGSPGTFTVQTLTTSQNLGVAEFGMIFEPTNPKYPYGTVLYQGEFSSSSQSHQISLELAWNF